jgi:hypothetical protein
LMSEHIASVTISPSLRFIRESFRH